MTEVLIVEDEDHLANGLKFNLEAEGYGAAVASNGETALEKLNTPGQFDLVLLDVMLPGIDGFEVVRRLREAGNYVPVMMLTARGRTEDVLKGFEAGADDYLPKPFDLAILVARAQGLLRRKQWARGPEAQEPLFPDTFSFADVTIDFERQCLVRGEQEQPLTLMEANLLRYLIRNAGRSVPRKALLEEVWGVREDTDTRAVDNFIVRLRRYIETEPSKPKHLLTVRGVGYRFVPEP